MPPDFYIGYYSSLLGNQCCQIHLSLLTFYKLYGVALRKKMCSLGIIEKKEEDKTVSCLYGNSMVCHAQLFPPLLTSF